MTLLNYPELVRTLSNSNSNFVTSLHVIRNNDNFFYDTWLLQ